MTSTYLQSLGFIPTIQAVHGSQAAFSRAWRYQYNYLAVDGARLFLEHPLGVDACRLSALEAPLAAQDIFASVGLHDRPALAAAMQSFFAAHGGMGRPLPVVADSPFRSFRRQL
jgi:hypothetical protein